MATATATRRRRRPIARVPVVGGTAPIVPVPGQPGESIAQPILTDVLYLLRKFKGKLTAGYATGGPHAAGGEHPRGLGVDIVPDARRGGTWDDIDRLAAFAREHPDVFAWIGYDGEPNHGRYNHLHLSWWGSRVRRGARETKTLAEKLAGGDDENLLDRLGNIAGDIASLPDPATAIGNLAEDVFDRGAEDTARAIVGLLFDALGKDGARVLLYIGLVGSGTAVAVLGLTRFFGVRGPDPAQLAQAVARKPAKPATGGAA